MSDRLAAIILAAGASSRMGSPKALLPWRGSTLLGHAIAELRQAGISELIAVLGLAHEAIEAAVDLTNVTVTYNLDEASGRSGSIRIAASALSDEAARIVVQSVDQPTNHDVLKQLLRADGQIVVPTASGRRGHPVCFSGALLPELRTATEETQGLRAVVRRHPVTEVDVGTDTVFWNLNDPQAYAAAVQHQ